MTSLLKTLTFSLLILLLSLPSNSLSSPPKSLILQITKDSSTLQYLTKISIGTPLVSKTLVVDLGGRYLWLDCQKDYISSSRKPAKCGSATCSTVKSMSVGCADCKTSPYQDCKTNCALFSENTVIQLAEYAGPVTVDTISIANKYGPGSRPVFTVPNFIFACANHSLLDGLAKGAKGQVTFGRNKISLPNQLKFRKFAICLPSAPKSNGVMLLGDTKYVFRPRYNSSKRNDVSQSFKHTPLLVNPISTSKIYQDDESSSDYYIGVKSIIVNQKAIPINPSLLKINATDFGFGGTLISTVYPYTLLESSIYNAFVDAIVKEYTALNISRVSPVQPFSACFSTERMSYGGLGPSTPDIGFVLGNNVVWGMYGSNVIVEVSKTVWCLGFVEGQPRHISPSIVIGAHQLENNLLEFDPASSRLSFTETLLWGDIDCQDFVPTH